MLEEKNIFLDCSFETKEDVFEFLSKKMVAAGYGTDKKEIIMSLEEREKLSTTGMLDGFAIPHAKAKAIKEPVVLILKNNNGIPWDSMDGEDIEIIFGLFIPEEEAGTTHLELLSKISRMLMKKEQRQLLKEAKDKKEIFNAIKKIM